MIYPESLLKALHKLHTGKADDSSNEHRLVHKYASQFRRGSDKSDKLGHVLCNTALSTRLVSSQLFRYHMELFETFYQDWIGDRKIARYFREEKWYRPLAEIIQQHYDAQPRETFDTTAECRMELWVNVIEYNLSSILQRCAHLKMESDPRLLALDECVNLDKNQVRPHIQVPNSLNKSRMVRAVNAFSERVQHTRPISKVLEQSDPDLGTIVGVHVCGTRERSPKPRSNGSLTMSATDDPLRAIQYAIFYGQVIPCNLWLDIDPANAVSTAEVLKACESRLHTAIHISTAHHEYIPKKVTHFPDEAIRYIQPLHIDGLTVNCVGAPRTEPFEEIWMQHEGMYTSPKLEQQLQSILRISTFGSDVLHKVAKKRAAPSIVPLDDPPKKRRSNRCPSPIVKKPTNGQMVQVDGSSFAGNRYSGKRYSGQIESVHEFSCEVRYTNDGTKAVLPLNVVEW